MTTTTDTTTDIPGLPVASAAAATRDGNMDTRTRPWPSAHMERTSALEDVIAGRDPYAIEGAAATDTDEPTKVLPPDSLAGRVDALVVREEARERHLTEMTRERDAANQRADQQDANLGRMGARLVAWEAYALALAAWVGFPSFDDWQAANRQPRPVLATLVEPMTSDQEQVPPSVRDLGDLVTVEPVEVSDG